MKIWILTEELNEYDQYGEYYRAAFSHKPTKEELLATYTIQNDFSWRQDEALEHLLNGGGRRGTEHHWYYLVEEEIA